jgi:hypothetical protein
VEGSWDKMVPGEARRGTSTKGAASIFHHPNLPDHRQWWQQFSGPACPHRFDTGFIPTADYADDHIIVTRSSPLISAVSRKRPGEYRIWGGSFIGGGGSRETAADEVAEYLARSPHWAHLMRLTLEMGWHDVHRALIVSFAELTKSNFPETAPAHQSSNKT